MYRKGLCLLSALALCVFVGAASADPVLSSTATQQPDSTWLYEYGISNDSPTAGILYDFLVYITGDPIAGSVVSPAGWYESYGGGMGFVEWYADWGYEIGVDESLGGFAFSSYLGPTQGMAEMVTEYGSDPYYMTYDATCYVPSAIPEPATIALVGIGACAALGLRRRRKK